MSVTIIRGLPGSGKTTLAKRWARSGAYHLEADQYHEVPYGDGETRYIFVGDNVKAAHQRCHRLAEELLKRGERIVVSNTFTRVWEMQGYINLAHDYNVPLRVFRCMEQFESVHDVPEEVIDNMRKRWEDYDDESLYYCGYPLLPREGANLSWEEKLRLRQLERNE